MYIYKSEFTIAAVIFGVLWKVIPWNPLNLFEGIVAGAALLVVSFAIVALVEEAAVMIGEVVNHDIIR